jgi:hypothetical protein
LPDLPWSRQKSGITKGKKIKRKAKKYEGENILEMM